MSEHGVRDTWNPSSGGKPAAEAEHLPRTLALFRKAVELLETLVEQIRGAWNHLLNEVNVFLARASQEVQSSIWTRIVEWWTDEVAKTLDAIRRKLQEIQARVDEILTTLQNAIAGAVPVGSLFERAMTYVTTLNRELSELSEDMSGSIDLVYWRGPSKESYDIKLQRQVNAVKSTHEKVRETGTWLTLVGKENMTYLAELGDRVAAIAGPFAAAIANASQATAGNAPQAFFALHSLSEVIGQAVAETLQYGINLSKRLSTVVAQIIALEESRDNNAGLSTGSWPRVAEG
jgi:hypothetical protein